MTENIDHSVVADFGAEWNSFDQSALSNTELEQLFQDYFRLFPWDKLPAHAVGFDMGCGSGRWAKFVSQKVAKLYCIDASRVAINVAKTTLAAAENCEFYVASVDNVPIADSSMDFAYSLGVLHHVPDTLGGVKACTAKLKTGAPFLLYLYYRFDNKPAWYRLLWQTSDVLRKVISRLPKSLKYLLSQLLAGILYWPLARIALVLEKRGMKVEFLPLSYYRDKAFYVMRNDALDRFGTRLEKRFTQEEIKHMLLQAGMENITFSERPPYWVALAYKK